MDKKVLGKKVKDTITGFEGIATGIAFYLNGCTRVCIQPRHLKDKDGGTVDSEWVDDTQIKVFESGGMKKEKEKTKATGGPQASPVNNKKSV